MIVYKRVSEVSELKQILNLQKKNMATRLSAEEINREGFITVSHTLDVLAKMNAASAHIIAKDGNTVVGYALVMLPSFRNEIPLLIPMFEAADQLLPGRRYVAMGQICIDKDYRKKGVFKGMYTFYKRALQEEYDCLFTEVATNNQRSLGAHKNLGFEVLRTQVDDGVSWELMCWDWSGDQ